MKEDVHAGKIETRESVEDGGNWLIGCRMRNFAVSICHLKVRAYPLYSIPTSPPFPSDVCSFKR